MDMHRKEFFKRIFGWAGAVVLGKTVLESKPAQAELIEGYAQSEPPTEDGWYAPAGRIEMDEERYLKSINIPWLAASIDNPHYLFAIAMMENHRQYLLDSLPIAKDVFTVERRTKIDTHFKLINWVTNYMTIPDHYAVHALKGPSGEINHVPTAEGEKGFSRWMVYAQRYALKNARLVILQDELIPDAARMIAKELDEVIYRKLGQDHTIFVPWLLLYTTETIALDDFTRRIGYATQFTVA